MNIDSIINKLSKKSTTRIESLHLLKSLKKEIRDKSASRIISIEDIKQIFQKILEDTDLIECPTFIVRLYLASCFSDAFYIFVPDIPLLTTGQLDAVFQLFSTVIPVNYQEESTEYNIIQSIIDVLNITDSYLLISNRDVSYEMIESMIKMKPVSNLNDRYDSNFQNAIKFIVNLINASTSDLILTEIERLFSTNFNSSLIVQKCLPLLSQNQQMSIVGSFQQHLNYSDFLKAFVTATKILKIPFGFVIQLLYPELINEDDSQRMAVFTLLNEIFRHNKSELSMITDSDDDENEISEDVKSINFILSRNIDKCPKIRLIIFQIASYFVESKNQTFLDKANNVIKNVHYDPNEGVRFTGLDIVWKLQKQNLFDGTNDENPEYDITIFLNDKSYRIREKALMYMCEIVKLSKRNSDSNQNEDIKVDINCLDEIISYCFDKPGAEIFMAFSILFDSFDSTELYEITTEKNKYMKVLNFIKTTSEYVKKYVETGYLSNNNLVKLLTKDIWKPFVPNKKFLQIREKYKTQDAIQVILKSTNEQFAKEFVALSIVIPVDCEKLIFKCSHKQMIKSFACFNPKMFCPYLPKILTRCDTECVSVLPFIFECLFTDPKQSNDSSQMFNNNDDKMTEILNLLISAGTRDSLIAFAKLLSKWNCLFSAKKKIFKITKYNEKLFFNYDNTQKEIYYQKYGTAFSLKFFFFLAIPDLMPNFFFKKSKKIDQNDNSSFSKENENQNKPSVTRFSYFLSPTQSFIYHHKRGSICEDDQIDSHYVKWSLRISTLFKEKEMVRIHFHFLESFPLQCLESLFRISNVISNDFTYSILLPYKSANDISQHFKDAQKKGKNLLNLISAENFRRIASLLVDSKNDDEFNMTKCYSKLNEKYWILSMVDEALKNPKTPIEFLSLIVLGLAFEKNDSMPSNDHINFNDLRIKIYEKAQESLVYHINLRRKFAYQNESSSPISSQSISDINDDQAVNFNSTKKIKKRNSSSKSSSNDQFQDEKLIKSTQSKSLLSGQQIELIIPSLFNVLAFLYFNQNNSINFKMFIDQLFDLIISNNQQKCMIFCMINEVKKAINLQSSFGKKMKVICEYAASKTSISTTISPPNFNINQKFITDDGNEF